MQIAPARLADHVAVLADQLATQEGRLYARGELDAFERRVALRRRGILCANRPALLRIDQHDVRVFAFGDIALRVKAETLRRIAARELGDAVRRKAALRSLGDERGQQVLRAAKAGFG